MSNFNIEVGKLNFASTDLGTITFELSYKSVPVVIASPEAGVNVFVESVSKTSAVIRTSNVYSGDIHYQVISND